MTMQKVSMVNIVDRLQKSKTVMYKMVKSIRDYNLPLSRVNTTSVKQTRVIFDCVEFICNKYIYLDEHLKLFGLTKHSKTISEKRM